MTPEAWAHALERALEDHAIAPWLLCEYRPPAEVSPSGEGRIPPHFPPAPWTVSLYPTYSPDAERPRLESVQAIFGPSRRPDGEPQEEEEKKEGAFTE